MSPRPSRPRRSQGETNGQGNTLDPFYILAASPSADEHARVLKHGETFAVFDHYGDITPAGLGEEGLFHQGTRHLSAFILRLGGDRPLFLSSTVKEDNGLLAVDLTNPDVRTDGQLTTSRGTLHVFRGKFLWRGSCYERLRLKSYRGDPVRLAISFHFLADFADIFEVRGTERAARGEDLAPRVEGSSVTLAYRGLDGVVRRTRLSFSAPPELLTGSEARFQIELPPHGESSLDLAVSCELDGIVAAPLDFENAEDLASEDFQRGRRRACDVGTSNERFNAWLARSYADLNMMISDTPQGPYPYAGVPWFSTPFGRDGLITAWQCLWIDPTVARGVLAYLADCQATETDAARDAEPGKILHETRTGEMAALGEVPFGRYYGSVDATPLFVALAAAYYRRTADLDFIESIWPNLERALSWIDTYGDADGDGFVEYARHSAHGLVHQGWKDSHDSVFHADGASARAPIALCEVQGYVYAAKRGAAELAAVMGRLERAIDLARQAEDLKLKFETAFWCDDIETYALALDGEKRPCRVRNSNAGHCLFTGIADERHARLVAATLLSDRSFSGWGVRTIAAGEARFNPMSYHNGSVWPHDNALIAAGLARYRLKTHAARILSALFEASLFVDLQRMPELFCGFERRAGEGPTLYPVACAPQSWAAASVFMLLAASLGLEIDAPRRRITFSHPHLPPILRQVTVCNLKVGNSRTDLLLERHGDDVGVNVLRREGNVEVVAIK